MPDQPTPQEPAAEEKIDFATPPAAAANSPAAAPADTFEGGPEAIPEEDRHVDKAMRDSFPASDPPAVSTPTTGAKTVDHDQIKDQASAGDPA